MTVADAPAAAEAPAAAPAPAPAAKGGPPPRKGGKREREPLPFKELRTAAQNMSATLDIADLKELFRLLPQEIRQEVQEGVREYRKGARRPLSVHAGRSLARAFHTARRNRRRPDADVEVAEALAQALAADAIASLDVERAAEVILPKRDLLDRQARQARRQQRDDEIRQRDEQRRRRAEGERGVGERVEFGEFTGPKIRGLDKLKELLQDERG